MNQPVMETLREAGFDCTDAEARKFRAGECAQAKQDLKRSRGKMSDMERVTRERFVESLC
jgi:hypothetical protein